MSGEILFLCRRGGDPERRREQQRAQAQPFVGPRQVGADGKAGHLERRQLEGGGWRMVWVPEEADAAGGQEGAPR